MTMLAKDVQVTSVVTVAPALSALEFEELLEREKISGAPVVDAGRLVGVVSRADLARALLAADRSADALLDYYRDVSGADPGPAEKSRLTGEQAERLVVRDLMSTRIVSVEPETPVRDVAGVMLANGAHRVLVAKGGQLLGVVSSMDLVRAIADGRLGDRQG